MLVERCQVRRRTPMGGLVKATRVLRSRYGRVHVQFAEPISLAELAARQGLPRSLDIARFVQRASID